MSYFPNMNNEQIAALATSDVVRRIDLACAEAGIPLFLEPDTIPKAAIERDMTLHKVAGILFVNEQDAARVAQSINISPRMTQCYYNYQYQRSEFEPDDSKVSVEMVMGYKPETWHARRAELMAEKDAEQLAAQVRERNKKASGRRADIATEVWREYNKAAEAVNEAARLNRLYEKYVALANGDQEMARRFLAAAEALPEGWQPPSEGNA